MSTRGTNDPTIAALYGPDAPGYLRCRLCGRRVVDRTPGPSAHIYQRHPAEIAGLRKNDPATLAAVRAALTTTNPEA